MDTTQKVSASTITEFLQTEDENGATTLGEARRHRAQLPRHHAQYTLYPPPPVPPEYFYYPPPMPPVQSLNYAYMEIIRQLSLQNELRSCLPKLDGLSRESNTKDCQSEIKKRVKQEDQKKDCDHSQHNESGHSHQNESGHTHHNESRFSHLCLSCEQRLRCSCCSQPLTPERMCLAANKPSFNPCQCVIPLHSLIQHNPIMSCVCSCQNQKEIKSKGKSKPKCNMSKCNQKCLQSDHDNIPERDNPDPSMKSTGKNFVKSNHKDEDCESSDSGEDCNQPESKREGYESDCKTDEEQRIGFSVGKGDENKFNSNAKKTGATNRIRKTRHSLAYFINV